MQPQQQGQPGQDAQDQQVMVVGPDGQPVGQVMVPVPMGPADGSDEKPGEMIEQPAKVMRIGSMVKQLLEEVRAAPLDEAARERLRDVHTSSIVELSDGLAPELREELARLSLPFSDEATPSDAELRVAQAQLVGWLEGLFHGIQTAMVAQQMAARLQMERAGRPAIAGPAGAGGSAGPSPSGGTGQYL